MTKIEIPGHFLFENGSIDFVFGDKAIEFHRIETVEQLRAVLVTIAQTGTQRSIEKLLNQNQVQTDAVRAAQTAYDKATNNIEGLLKRTERSFQEHVAETERGLQQAQKDYEAATSTVIQPDTTSAPTQ